jgi:putative transposase
VRGDRFPATSTIGEILKRRSQIRPRRARLRVPMHPSPLEPCSEPNELWCTDFKGHFALGDRTRCHPLTITDAASRYLIKCEGLVAEGTELERPDPIGAFREAKRELVARGRFASWSNEFSSASAS